MTEITGATRAPAQVALRRSVPRRRASLSVFQPFGAFLRLEFGIARFDVSGIDPVGEVDVGRTSLDGAAACSASFLMLAMEGARGGRERRGRWKEPFFRVRSLESSP
jgi:hypothetical protein